MNISFPFCPDKNHIFVGNALRNLKPNENILWIHQSAIKFN
jgi:hypothetical protein